MPGEGGHSGNVRSGIGCRLAHDDGGGREDSGALATAVDLDRYFDQARDPPNCTPQTLDAVLDVST